MLPSEEFRQWIKPLAVTQTETEMIYILAPNKFCAEWVQARHEKDILKALATQEIACKAIKVYYV